MPRTRPRRWAQRDDRSGSRACTLPGECSQQPIASCVKDRFAGMSDGPTTSRLDLDARVVVIDVHAVRDTAAVGILMACASACLSGLLERMAENPASDPLINVSDESWRIVQHAGLAEWFQRKVQARAPVRRIRGLLHARHDVFDPDRDRGPFGEHPPAVGCQPDMSGVR